jgi:hypothetical protein
MQMKKAIWIFLVLISLTILLSSCTNNVLPSDNHTSVAPMLSPSLTQVPIPSDHQFSTSVSSPDKTGGITPTPPTQKMSRDANNPEYYFVDKANLENMGMTLQDLSQQEMDTLIRIGLNVNPVLEKTKQGMSYRTQIGWATYNKSAIPEWGFTSYNAKDLIKKPNINDTFFPAVEIGLGTPQQYFIRVAVDLGSEKAVYADASPDKHVSAPANVKPLTEEQKAKLIEIGSNTEDFKMFIGSNKYNIRFQWVAVYGNGGSSGLEYDIFEKGIRDNLPLAATIYPAVVFDTGSWIVRVAIDLQNSTIMDSTNFPSRRGPLKYLSNLNFLYLSVAQYVNNPPVFRGVIHSRIKIRILFSFGVT